MQKRLEFTIDLRYHERKDATAQKFVIEVYGIGLVQ